MKLFLSIALLLLWGVYGFSQEVNETKVKLFPNPATNVVNVLGLTNDMDAIILIYDTYGNLVMHRQWNISNNALNIPVAQLEKGIYLLTIESEHQKIKTKFLKQ